nr:FkbM family methyltransferase [Flavihumibacter sp. UBA7668]
MVDLGANTGKNLPYYLSKAEKVVAVEANPALAASLMKEFATQIESGKLHIENKCITSSDFRNQSVDFYIHRYHSGLSRFPAPDKHTGDFKKIQIPACSYPDLTEKYGKPDMVKIDLEGADLLILNSILASNQIPDYISVENWGLPVLTALLEKKIFSSFNLVSFYNFKSIYGYSGIDTAGPFGADIKSPWLNQSHILDLYHQIPDPWFDIHASVTPYPMGKIDLAYYKKTFNLLLWLKSLLPHQLKSRIKDLTGFSR